MLDFSPLYRNPGPASVLLAAVLAASSPEAAAAEAMPVLQGGSCVPAATVLCLQAGRMQVEVDWEDFNANTGDGQVLPFSTDDTGFFWFSDADHPEVFVKVLDGTAFNGFFWVFFASLTNFEYTLVVTDTTTGGQAQYMNPLGSSSSVNDIMALPGDPPLTESRKHGYWPSISDWIFPQSKVQGLPPGSMCTPSSTVLCLDGGRFQVEVDWDDGQGGMGAAPTVPLTDFSGYFWFFSPSSAELAARIIDGGDGHFWFYFGATTNVEYTLTVTEICSGQVNTYFNPLGNLTSGADFEAFPAGPECGIFGDGFESGDRSAW